MTRRRWIADEVSSNHAALTGDHADHLLRLLRAQVGQDFDIATGASIRRGRITSIADNRVEFELAEEISVADPVQIILLLAVFKFDRMEWAIEKCTELGVTRIIPVVSRRTDSHLAAASKKQAPPRDTVNPDTANGEIILAIGPEGGWTEDELKSFRQAAWTSASLGNTILRAETAAIAATAIVVSTLSSR